MINGTSLRLLQISDAHLSADPAAYYRGVHPYARLQQLMPAIQHWQPDIVVASGDLSHDCSPASYQHLVEALSPLPCPVMLIPGNHDDIQQQRALCIQQPSWRVLCENAWENQHWYIDGLNSQWGDRPDGLVSEAALSALGERLREHSEQAAIIFIHHHPFAIGTPWIDRFPLLNSQRLWQQLAPYPQLKILACGHTHQAFQQQRGDINIIGAPACSINTQAGVRYFKDDGKGPAARWFELHANGQWASGILYCGGSENAPKTMEHRLGGI
ncbi:MAG: metallophosphoesterase [Xanthomonadales bacterium]|nr:metallophosphoesterase [Xanthomonadales bacterium]